MCAYSNQNHYSFCQGLLNSKNIYTYIFLILACVNPRNIIPYIRQTESPHPPRQKLLIINIKDCQTRLFAYYSLLFLPYLLDSHIDLLSHGSFASFSHTKNWNVERRPLRIISILDELSYFDIQNVLATNYTSCSHAHVFD